MNIYLVGFMGTGKTSVGKELAKRKKWQFVDLDELIELRQGRAIADIFAKEGEAYFRSLEKQALKDVAKEKNFVVACGGGIVLHEENIKLMKETGKLICLKASPAVILKRTEGYLHRPLLNVPDPKARATHLLKLRSAYYAKAHTSVDTSKLSIEDVAKFVDRLVKVKSKKTKTKARPKNKRR